MRRIVFGTAALAAMAASAPAVGQTVESGVIRTVTVENEVFCVNADTGARIACPAEALDGAQEGVTREVYTEKDTVIEEILLGDVFYLGLKGGLSYFRDYEFNPGTRWTASFDPGGMIAGQIGYEFVDVAPRTDLRFDLEAGYMAAAVDEQRAQAAVQAGGDGDADAFFLFTNAYVDFNLFTELEVFVGGGVGLGFINFDGFSSAAAGTVLDDDAAAFGAHIDAGAAFEVTERITLEASYRFTHFSGFEVSPVGQGGGERTLMAHQALLGLRLKF